MRPSLPLALLLCLAAVPAAADSLRCGAHLVNDGDTRAQVADKCGDPVEVEHRTILRRPAVWVHGRRVFVGNGEIEVPVDLWVYNLGPNQFMRRVRFENGVVVAIDTLDYGYTK